jgi:hypothetical protein
MKAVKRALWCRWFHRWHPTLWYGPHPGGQARTVCWACEDRDYGTHTG